MKKRGRSIRASWSATRRGGDGHENARIHRAKPVSSRSYSWVLSGESPKCPKSLLIERSFSLSDVHARWFVSLSSDDATFACK